METIDAIMTRRSVRAYKKDPVSKEQLDSILRAGAAAPSGGNRQPWTFIVICDRRRLQGVMSLSPGLFSEPCVIIAICLDETRVLKTEDSNSESMVWMDLGAAMENILLAAHDQGLGACAIGSFHEQGVSDFLRLPPSLKLALLVSIGVPVRVPAGPKKRPSEEVIFFEEYRGQDGHRNS
jgi:nitroreductase